jgi:hypothetical protein
MYGDFGSTFSELGYDIHLAFELSLLLPRLSLFFASQSYHMVKIGLLFYLRPYGFDNPRNTLR